MREALVQDAQDDVDDDNRHDQDEPETVQRILERQRRALERGRDRRRQRRGRRRLDFIDRVAERVAGPEVERDRHRRQLPGVADRERPRVGGHGGERVQRDQTAARGPDVEHRHRGGILLEFRRDLQNHLILVVRRVDLRHLTRAVGVVQRRLHLIHGQAERRNLVAVHRYLDLRILHLEIAADVLEAWYFADFGLEDRRPVIELRGVRVLQRELVQAARAPLAAEVDRWLVDQEHPDTRYLR